MPGAPDATRDDDHAALAVALDLEWDDDYALERAALAAVGVSLVRRAELQERDLAHVVALLTAGTCW